MLAIADLNISKEMDKDALAAIAGKGYWLGRVSVSQSTSGWSSYYNKTRVGTRFQFVRGCLKLVTRYRYNRVRRTVETSQWDWVH